MIWKDGLTWEARKAKKEKWHKWFAWFPIVIEITDDGHKVKCWLETVERCGEYCGSWDGCYWNWWYRKVQK